MTQSRAQGSFEDMTPSVLLQKAKEGDKTALKALLEQERPLLYDYLLRMTGQIQKSLDTIDELFFTMNPAVLIKYNDYKSLRLNLVRSARKFALDMWNADTSMLQNAAFPTSGKKNKEKSPEPELNLEELFDRAYASLPGTEREVLWLRWNLEWQEAEIARLMFKAPEEILRFQEDSIKALQAFAPLFADYTIETMGQLLRPHPIRRIETPEVTMELSRVIKGIKTAPAPVIKKQRFRIPLFIAAVILLAMGLRWACASGGRSSSSMPRPPSKGKIPPQVPKRADD